MSRVELDALQSVEKNKQAMRELVDEVLYLEQELGRAKTANAALAAQLEDARFRLADFENGNAVRSLKQMISDQQAMLERQSAQAPASQRKASSTPLGVQHEQRMAALEALVLDEQRAREQAERAVVQLQHELERAKDEARMANVHTTISRTEVDTERDQRRDLRDEFSRVQRNNEAAVREQRAGEKRYEALLDELHQVMAERDEALQGRDEAKRARAEEERACQHHKLQADDARAARDAAVERAVVAERARDLATTQKDAEERQRMAAQADLTMVRSQLETLIVERDAALRENERMSSRLDEALTERRAAVQARAEAMAVADLAAKTAEEAEHKARSEARRALDAEARRVEAEARADDALSQTAELGMSLRRAAQELEEAKEVRLEAERDLEAAQRQVRALNEEMKSVLKARDAALAQREEAFLREERARGEATGAGLATADRLQREERLQRDLEQARANEAAAMEQCRRLERRLADAQQQQQHAVTPKQLSASRVTPGRGARTPLRGGESLTLAVEAWVPRALQDAKRARHVLDHVKAVLQREAREAPSPSRLPREQGGDVDALLSHLAQLADVASDVGERAESVVERLQASKQAGSQLQRRVEQLEWQLARGGGGGGQEPAATEGNQAELDYLRRRAAELERAVEGNKAATGLARRLDALASSSVALESGFDIDLRALHRELQAKQAEVDALREQQALLYQEIETLNLRLQRATPHRHEVEQLRERLRQALRDLEVAEGEALQLRAQVRPIRGDV